MSDFANLWTIVCQAPLSTGFIRQEYWSGLSRAPPGDLPNPGTEPVSLMSPALSLGNATLTSKDRKISRKLSESGESAPCTCFVCDVGLTEDHMCKSRF